MADVSDRVSTLERDLREIFGARLQSFVKDQGGKIGADPRTLEKTIAERLRAAGYATWLSGKWHCGGHYDVADTGQWKLAGSPTHPIPLGVFG